MGTTDLKRTLGKFLLAQIVFAMVLLVFHIGTFAVLLDKGVILSANRGEVLLENTREGVETGSLAWQDIPTAYNVKVMDQNGAVLQNDIPPRHTALLEEALREGQAFRPRMLAPVAVYYIEGSNYDVALSYTVAAQFSDKNLRKWFPFLEATQLLLFFGMWVTGFVILLNRFTRPIQKDLNGLVAVNDEIARGNLDFALPESHLQEIQDVLHAISQMKGALGTALREEWKAKQTLNDSLRGIAHDVRTPLTLIQGNLELLASTPLNVKQTTYVAHAQNGVGRFYDYLAELQDLSRGATPRDAKSPLSAEVLSHWVVLAESIAEAKAIHVQTDIQAQPSIRVHEKAFAKAFQNVVQNAVEHAPQESTLFLKMIPQGGGYCVVVEDEGPGFSPAALKNALEDGFSTRLGADGHHGLGLTIARDMMRRNQGTIALANRPEGGARVSLSLPETPADPKRNLGDDI